MTQLRTIDLQALQLVSGGLLGKFEKDILVFMEAEGRRQMGIKPLAPGFPHR